MRFFCLIMLISVSFSTLLPAQDGMDNTQMEKLLKEMSREVEGEAGNWKVIYREQILFIITDETNNRMRIFAPIMAQDKLETGQLEAMLEANFHAALDAKYALFNGVVASLFTHPLKELTDAQFLDAAEQVATAAENFGTTYSSANLIFGGGLEDNDAPKKDKKVNKKPQKKT